MASRKAQPSPSKTSSFMPSSQSSSPSIATKSLIALFILNLIIVGDLFWTFSFRSSLLDFIQPNNHDESHQIASRGAVSNKISKSLSIIDKNKDKNNSIQINQSPIPDTVPLNPIWQCHELKHDSIQKLFFVHVFKTAGSSMRHLLQDYAEKCHAGYSLVVDCADLQYETTQNSMVWTGRGKRGGQGCRMKQAINREKSEQLNMNKVTTSFLNEHTDILAGHIELGSDSQWKVHGQPVDTHYLTFFRHPIQQYVSGLLFGARKKKLHMNYEETLDYIRQAVTSSLSKGKYVQKYKNYLVTPKQREIMVQNMIDFSPKEYADLVMANMIASTDRMIFGVVEQMSESLEMLQYMIDSNHEATEIFQRYGMKVLEQQQDQGSNDDKNKMIPAMIAGAAPVNATAPVVRNQSEFSTSELVKELKKDIKFAKSLEEIVKYEMPIYELAVELHHKQYESFTQAAMILSASVGSNEYSTTV